LERKEQSGCWVLHLSVKLEQPMLKEGEMKMDYEKWYWILREFIGEQAWMELYEMVEVDNDDC
jgi:hypothetical protein